MQKNRIALTLVVCLTVFLSAGFWAQTADSQAADEAAAPSWEHLALTHVVAENTREISDATKAFATTGKEINRNTRRLMRRF